MPCILAYGYDSLFKNTITITKLWINNDSINCKNGISSCQLQTVLLKYVVREGKDFKKENKGGKRRRKKLQS